MGDRRFSRWTAVAAAGVVMATLVSGCGDGDDGDEASTPLAAASTNAPATSALPAPTPAAPVAAVDGDCPAGRATAGSGVTPEVTAVRVAALPLEGFAPLFYAASCGYFEAEGLDVTLEVVQSGPVAGQLLTAGTAQFSFNNWFSVVQQVSNGAPLMVVANGARVGEGYGAVFVAPDSEIDEPAELVGATLATNALRNAGDIATAARLDAMGIEGRPEWIETPLPDTIAAIQSGAVDGGMLPEPFDTAARAAGLREVLPLFVDETDDLPIAGYVSVAPFVEANPNTVAAFRAGIEQATKVLAADEKGLRAFLPRFSPIPPAVAETVTLSDFQSELTAAEVQRAADLMYELGFLEESVDMAPHVHQPAGA